MNIIKLFNHDERFLTGLTIDKMMKIIIDADAQKFASPHDVYLGLLVAERSAIKAIVKFSDENGWPVIPVGEHAELYLEKLRKEIAE